MTVTYERAPHLWPRALAATVLVLTGAVGAHTWAGGHVPGLPGVLALAGVVLGGSLVVLRGLLTGWVLLPAVAVAQTGLHGMFGLLGEHAAHAGHLSSGGAPAEATAAWSWQMVAAHALGTLLTVLAWWLCDRAVLAVLAAQALAPAYVGRRGAAVCASGVARPALVHLVAAPRRGPPAGLRRA